MSGIFALNAPEYYAHGLQVIPLYEREKKPIPSKWSMFSNEAVSETQQREWLSKHPHGNMGLVLGEKSGVVCIDIDTDDPDLFNAILSVLPPSPWMRRGKKGVMLAFKYSSAIRTFRVKRLTGEMIVECLGKGTQCVMPPSIHPETGQAYSANTLLYNVMEKLQFLPEDIETRLRAALTDKGVELSHSGWSRVTDFVSPGSRDTTLTEHAGLFAYAVVRGERTLKEAIGMLIAFNETFVEKVAGDEVDINKHIGNLIKFLHRDVLDKNKSLPKGWDKGYTEQELRDLGVTLDAVEHTEWEFEQARDYLLSVFEEARPGSRDRVEAVEIVLEKMSKSPNLSKIDEDRILTYIMDVSGIGVKLSTLRNRLKELRLGDVKGDDHSEIARAMLDDLQQYMTIRYHNENFWKWEGSHWSILERNEIKAKISQNYGTLQACRKDNDIKGILNVMSYICEQGIQKKAVPGVNFANGFLTEDLTLQPHDKDYGMTYTLPFRYLPEKAGDFLRFDKFLQQCWGHDEDYEEKKQALREALAVTLFGRGSTYQRAILLHGAPRSGKSQLMRIVQVLVPDEGKCSVAPDQWGERFPPAMIANKILNICGELSENKLIPGQKFKDIVDGSTMSGEFKNGQIFTFAPFATHWFASNHFPKSTDTSSGFTRRWLVLHFSRPVQADERIADIGDLIAAEEKEAIVAWAVQAILPLKERAEFTLPKSHSQVMYQISNLNNSVLFFLNECNKVKFEKGSEIGEMKLYNAYWNFCATVGGMKSVQAPKFRSMLQELQTELPFTMEMREIGGSLVNVITGIHV